MIKFNTPQFSFRCVRNAWSCNPFRNNHFLFFCELVDYEDHEVQRASGSAANESQENSTKENEASVKVAATKIAVDNETEDKTSTDPGSSNQTAELRALLSDTVSSNIEGNHQLTAKKGGKRNRIKSKEVGVVESHYTSEEENLTSLGEKSKRLL